MEKSILVIGGTGMLGQPISRALKEAGFRVRIMTRDCNRATKLFDDSFEIITGNPVETDALEEALRGCYGVHMNLPGEIEQQVAEAVARLAGRQGVERISYISGATVSEENRWFSYINHKFLAEKAIREAGVPYTIFCPTWFMESLPLFVVKGRASVIGKQPYPYHWIAAEDYARMVSTAFELATAPNRRFVVHGPEAIRMEEALGRYCAVCQPDIKKVSKMPIWLVKLLGAVTRNQELKEVSELMAYFDKVGEGSTPANLYGLLDPPTTTLDKWLERRKEGLSPSGPELQPALK